MSLFRGYAKFKIGQQIFRAIRNAMRNRNRTTARR
jgi:hypothetical protein